MLIAGGFGGCAGLLASGFAIGAKGWSFGILGALFGELAQRQFGLGLGGALALGTLAVLGAGLARRGLFRGDLFVAGAVVSCGALLALFIIYPVAKTLVGAFVGEDGAPPSRPSRVASVNERNWGLGCFAGGVRCGVAWNTIFLASPRRRAPRCWAR